MQKHVYEYAVIRVVPRVEREEFINVGVVVFCKHAGYLGVKILLNELKLTALSEDIDCDQVTDNLLSFARICEGSQNGGPIAMEEKPERFRWLTAVRSSIIQTSRPHPGMTSDLDAVLEKLYEEYVL